MSYVLEYKGQPIARLSLRFNEGQNYSVYDFAPLCSPEELAPILVLLADLAREPGPDLRLRNEQDGDILQDVEFVMRPAMIMRTYVIASDLHAKVPKISWKRRIKSWLK